jgi:cytochrome c oxidase subunit 2
VIPLLILVCMAYPATKTLLAYKDTSASDMTIKVTGYQWKWGYDYVKGEGEGINFLSALATPQDQITGSAVKDEHYLLEVDRPLVVPTGKKVRLLITANDVIHAWWVPAFGVKQDAIPGFVRDTWFLANKTGDYYGMCSELCGKEHAFMPIHVIVMSAPDYTAWVDKQKKALAALADDPKKVWDIAPLEARGEKVYLANCAVCHKPDGKGAGPVKPLDASPVVNDKDPNAQILTVLHGRVPLGMPAWQGKLSETDIAAAITYTKNSWSNHTGQLVEPSDVVAAEAK